MFRNPGANLKKSLIPSDNYLSIFSSSKKMTYVLFSYISLTAAWFNFFFMKTLSSPYLK